MACGDPVFVARVALRGTFPPRRRAIFGGRKCRLNQGVTEMNRDKMIASLSGLRFFTLGAFVAALGGVTSAVHAQDECINAQVLQVGTPISFTFSPTFGTPSANPPLDTQCADGTFVWTAATPDLWYRFVAPSTGLATFDTCYPDPFNSADTSIALYAGECGSLTQVACSGDYFGLNGTPTGCSFTSSRVASFEVISGQTYYLRIGSVANANITTETRPGNISVRMAKVAAWVSEPSARSMRRQPSERRRSSRLAPATRWRCDLTEPSSPGVTIFRSRPMSQAGLAR